MINLGVYKIDEYLPILIQANDTGGSAADLDSGSFSIDFYEFNRSTGGWSAMTTPDTTISSKLDSKTGLYSGSVQLTSANGFEVGKDYAFRIGEGTVDGETPAVFYKFSVETKARLGDLNDIDGSGLSVDLNADQSAATIGTVTDVTNAVVTDAASRIASKADVSNLDVAVSSRGTGDATLAGQATIVAAIAALNDLGLDDTVDGVTLTDLLTALLSMASGKIERAGNVYTFKKRDNNTTAFTLTIATNSRTRS